MSIMKRKKQLLLMSLAALLVIGFGYGIYSVVPQLLAGDTQVADLTLKSQVNDQTIQLTVSDQNQSDTKVVVPLSDNLTYTPTNQTNAGVTYDQVNHQIVIDWLENHAKTANLTVKAEQAGTYVFKAQTTRDEGPVNTLPTSATVKPVESTPTNSVLNSSQRTLSEKSAVLGLQEQDTTSSPSLDTKQATQQQKNSTKDLPDHADTDIVTPEDLGNQEWLLTYLKQIYKLNISAGGVTFGDLKKVNSIIYGSISNYNFSGVFPTGMKYFPNLTYLNTIDGIIGITGGFENVKGLNKLQSFEVKGNKTVTGSIPKVFGQLESLEQINLSNNRFSGEIPVELGQLKNLSIWMNLDDNELEGNIPETFSNFQSGTLIRVMNNHKMYGVIPQTIVKKLRLLTSGTQLTSLDPQKFRSIAVVPEDKSDSFVSLESTKKLINYVNPTYKNSNGWVKLPLIAGSQKIKVFDSLNANLDTIDKHILNLGLGSRTVTTGDTTPLLPSHTYQITDVTGKTVYDGPADPNFTLSPTTKDTQYVIRMDHTQETIKNGSSNNNLVATIVLNVEAKLPKTTQSLQVEDPNVGTGNQIKYVKDKPFKMISTLQNADTVDFTIGKMNEKVKVADKDKVSIDPASFEMQKPNTTTWEAISASDVQETAEGYQVNFKDMNLKPTEKIKLRYSVTAKEAFTDTAVLTHQALLSNGQELPILNNDMTIKNGELIFKSVPATMSFADSKIANLTTEIKRKLPDWKMQIEDSRVNKTDWHITANLISELQNSNGDSLGDSVVFKKTGQPNQVINTTSAVDVYDGKAWATDYQDVQWGADAGPTLSVAPGLAKLGSYTGTMQWTLVDAPA